ncbi:MAG: hypothetical protein OEX08_03710 [Candidatus Nomurabacteria bacterium]|nr:hypothetical protein [Candidatus Nomurabacteria bacterium]
MAGIFFFVPMGEKVTSCHGRADYRGGVITTDCPGVTFTPTLYDLVLISKKKQASTHVDL